jgi:hypothetical protein
MMLDVAVSPELRELDKRLSNNNFGCFLPPILSPIRDNRMSRHRMNTAVVRLDNQKGYINKARRRYPAKVNYYVTKIVLKCIAHNKKLRHTCTKFSHNYDESSYVFEGSPYPRQALLFA